MNDDEWHGGWAGELCLGGGGGEARSVEEWGVTGAEDMEK